MAELAYATDLKSVAPWGVRVQVPLPAPSLTQPSHPRKRGASLLENPASTAASKSNLI